MWIRKKVAGPMKVSIGAMPSVTITETESRLDNDDAGIAIGHSIVDGVLASAFCKTCKEEFNSFLEYHKHSCKRVEGKA